jgi:hypothetical protein
LAQNSPQCHHTTKIPNKPDYHIPAIPVHFQSNAPDSLVQSVKIIALPSQSDNSDLPTFQSPMVSEIDSYTLCTANGEGRDEDEQFHFLSAEKK